MSITKFNKAAKVFNTELPPNSPYVSLKELYQNNGKDKVYDLCGMYINTKGKFGDQAVIYTDKFYVNTPGHMLERCQEILHDQETIDDINAGRCGFTVYAYTDQNGTERYSISFVEIERPF
jgi:hypothetical protein